jgi:hypothetical protein
MVLDFGCAGFVNMSMVKTATARMENGVELKTRAWVTASFWVCFGFMVGLLDADGVGALGVGVGGVDAGLVDVAGVGFGVAVEVAFAVDVGVSVWIGFVCGV